MMKRREFLKRTVPAVTALALAPVLVTHLNGVAITDDAVLVAYKGKQLMDTGYFYCPYIPLTFMGTTEEIAQQRITFKTRYGEVTHGV